MICLLNKHVYNQTTSVRDCLERLESLDVRVAEIRIGGRQPVIHVEPATTAGLEGAMYMRESIRGQVIATYVLPMLGCQVRWPAPLHAQPTPDAAMAGVPA